MKEFKLPLLRVYELTSVIDSIQPKDLGDLKSIRLAAGIVNDLKTLLKDYAEKSDALAQKQLEILKPYQEEYKAKGELSEEEAKKFAAELDARFQAEVKEKFGTEQLALNEQGQAETAVELGDEKFGKLKELFEKNTDKYLKKEVLLIVADALEAATSK